MNSKIVLFLALFFGLLAAVSVNYYLNEHTAPAGAEVSRKAVVTAQETIPAHTRITAEMIERQTVPEDLAHPSSIQAEERVVGTVTRSEIVEGEQVLQDRILAGEDQNVRLSYQIPDSKRAISIPVSSVSGVSGFVSPGDRVDVLATYTGELPEDAASAPVTNTILQDVPVLATGEEVREREGEAPKIVETVTLAVTPEQAEVVSFAHVQGSLHLSLRSPLDEKVERTGGYGMDNFAEFEER